MAPNWCECDLAVSLSDGSFDKDIKGYKPEMVAKLKAFVESAKSDGGDALDIGNKWVPYPEKFAKQDKEAHAKRNADEVARLAYAREKYGVNRIADIKDDDKRKDVFEKHPSKYYDDGFNAGGYEWCLENWGTKWGICNPCLRDDNAEGGTVYYAFESAWSPPTPIILAMSKAHPDLVFDLRYFEMGCGFNGWYQCKAGEVLHDENGPYFGSRGG